MSGRRKFVVYPHGGGSWRWKISNGRPRLIHQQNPRQTTNTNVEYLKRDGALLRLLAQELLSDAECKRFLHVLQQFRLTHSVVSLCDQLKPIINTTHRLILLIELNKRIPVRLQEQFRVLCFRNYPYYSEYVKLLSENEATDNYLKNLPTDFSGAVQIVARGSKKKVMRKISNYQRRRNILTQSLTKASDMTSGIYSDSDDETIEHRDDVVDENISDNADVIGMTGSVSKTLSSQMVYPTDGTTTVKRVVLRRENRESLGLGITGGREFGCEVIISVVEDGGLAASQGLRIGDKVLDVNGHSFHGIMHLEAVKILRKAGRLSMYVERSPGTEATFTRQDDIQENSPITHDILLAVFPLYNGKIGCDIQNVVENVPLEHTVVPVPHRLPVNVLMTRVFGQRADSMFEVTEVLRNSPAAKAGFKVGDLILKIDNIDITELSDYQIKMLTYSKRLTVLVRRHIISSLGQETEEVDAKR